MATVSKEMAMSLIAADGYYPGDPRATKVVRYTNNWGGESYAIVWPSENQMRYELSDACHNVEVLWSAS
jgi:hypothetical protein